MLRTLATIIDIIVCIALCVCVLMQEGKQAGLGAISGGSNSYWNKKSSKEGVLGRLTVILTILFFVLSLAISMHPFG